MSENLLAIYLFVRYIKTFPRKKKKKSDNMVVNVTKTSQKLKSKSLLRI